jgi:hypothetical protein
MHKSRAITRENRKKGWMEEKLKTYNNYGIYDPTPKLAVDRMIQTSAHRSGRGKVRHGVPS